LKGVPDVYPLCREQALVKEALGITCGEGGRPSEVGVTVLGTAHAIELARFLKTGLPMYEQIVTLSGEGFRNPKNVRVRIGTPLSAVVQEIGGYADGAQNGRLIAGGPFKGASVVTDELSILSTTPSFLCLTDTEREASPCIHCGHCVDYCPVGLQPVQIMMAHKARDRGLLKKMGVDRCVECGDCAAVCPSYIELTNAMTKAKAYISSKK
jgi:electron transport complex protein RnfC